MQLEQNLGPADRIVRAILGGLLLAAPARMAGMRLRWGVLAALTGLILVFTAGTGSCTIYRLLGISTRRS